MSRCTSYFRIPGRIASSRPSQIRIVDNMIISSRTPEGEPNRCAVCGHRCRIEPSCLTPDAPCPSCGQLLWFPQKTEATRKTKYASSVLEGRPKRFQGLPTARAPEVQAARLIGRSVRRGEKRFGNISKALLAELAAVKDPRHAERLLSLLPTSNSWGEWLAMWYAEQFSLATNAEVKNGVKASE